MSKRHPSRSAVRLIPPTTVSASRMVELTPLLVSTYAAVSPAGPAPTMTTLGDSVDSVVTKAAPSQLVGSGRRRVRPSTTVYEPRWRDSRTRPPGSRHVDAEEAQHAVPHEA